MISTSKEIKEHTVEGLAIKEIKLTSSFRKSRQRTSFHNDEDDHCQSGFGLHVEFSTFQGIQNSKLIPREPTKPPLRKPNMPWLIYSFTDLAEINHIPSQWKNLVK
uniref:Uncharacterized protein n=1 Tax=Vespula pensylvanica TaxID=30213 RepID=A0A834KCF3_VESPE|nr:hypothetical protein H0235_014890 [Vespula pensylvanica]